LSKVLITGGAGFIGSHLAEALLCEGFSVLCLDDLSTGNIKNLDEVISDHRFKFVHGSVLDPVAVDEAVRDVDVVVHLAAAVGVKLIIEKPLKSLIVNIEGTRNVLEAAERWKKKLLITSTSEVYGKNPNQPFSETSDRILGSVTVARWSYSTAKAIDEILALTYFKEGRCDPVIVRLFNTVGPRQIGTYGMVIPRLVSQALRGEDLTIYGDGNQTRCFCHVKDVVRALMLLIEEPKAIGEIFNVGSTEEVSINQLANMILDMTGSKSRIKYIPLHEAYEEGFEDMERRVPDTKKVKDYINWEPECSLEMILKDVIDDLREQMKKMS
jgi:UDP-glucose 4-epimerase